MDYNKDDKGKSGIYCIKNKANDKIYIGKAKCILSRIQNHANRLDKKSKDENIHLVRAWHKYGRECFEYSVLEYLEFNDLLLKERELYWITTLDALVRGKGYNLRLDSKDGLVCLTETKKRLSDAQKARFLDPKEREKISISSSNIWRDKERLEKMKTALSLSRSKYYFLQCTKNEEVVALWKTMKELLDANPTYKRHNIYAVCSGEKPSMYGFTWKKIPKK